MDDLETLVRDTLREHAAEAPEVSVLLERRPRRLALLAVTASAAAVALVVGLVLALHPTGGSSGRPAGRATAAPPAGYEWASYHGVEIAVPKIIQWVYVTCYPPTTSYVEFTVPNVAISCPGRPLTQSAPDPDSVSVTLAPVGTPLDGPVIGDHRPQQTRTLADPGVIVTVAAPTQAQVDLILGSIHRTPVDHLGCTQTAGASLQNAPTSSLAPSNPNSALVCSYALMKPGDKLWLVGSHELDRGAASGLAGALNALSDHTVHDGVYVAPTDLVVFRSPAGTHTVEIERYVVPAMVFDGQHNASSSNGELDPWLPDI